jgi:hypothetical protein
MKVKILIVDWLDQTGFVGPHTETGQGNIQADPVVAPSSRVSVCLVTGNCSGCALRAVS